MANQQLALARAFCKNNLKDCCADLADWDKTGILRDGKLRELTKLCEFAGHSDLAVAKGIVTQEAVEFVGSTPWIVLLN